MARQEALRQLAECTEVLRGIPPSFVRICRKIREMPQLLCEIPGRLRGFAPKRSSNREAVCVHKTSAGPRLTPRAVYQRPLAPPPEERPPPKLDEPPDLLRRRGIVTMRRSS